MVAAAQKVFRLIPPFVVDGANGVNNFPTRQSVGICDLRIAGIASIQGQALLGEIAPGRAVYGTVNSPTTVKELVCRIHDAVNLQLRDIVAYVRHDVVQGLRWRSNNQGS